MASLTALPAFQDNYIWLLHAANGGAIVVDPGDAGPVLAACAHGFRLDAILITHHHQDHAGGIETLQQAFDIPCFAPEDPRIRGRLTTVRGGDLVRVPGWQEPFEIKELPGHTLSHIGFIGSGLLFCGDTLFSLGCGRLFEGSPAQMLDSLDQLAALPGTTQVCCGHEYTAANARFALAVEPDNQALIAHVAKVDELRRRGQPSLPSTIEVERACNPFLRVLEASVIDAVARHWQRNPSSDPIATFAGLRAWKDEFKGQ